MADDPATALAELSQAIAGAILTLPDLSEPEWDTYSLVAEVSDASVKITPIATPRRGRRCRPAIR